MRNKVVVNDFAEKVTQNGVDDNIGRVEEGHNGTQRRNILVRWGKGISEPHLNILE